MVRCARADLYCEDQGHELFVRALIKRLTREERCRIEVRTRSGRGGHGRAVSEFKAWQRATSHHGLESPPDLLVLVIDGNCSAWGEAHSQLKAAVDSSLFSRFVVGCPDPHVERWCIADPESFSRVVGVLPLPDPGKCDRDEYKRLLRESLSRGGQPILTDPMEFAPDLVDAMDLFRAGKNQSSLRLFVEDLRKTIRSIAGAEARD